MRSLSFWFVILTVNLMLALGCKDASSNAASEKDSTDKAGGLPIDTAEVSASMAAKDSVSKPAVPQTVKLYWYVSGTNVETGEDIPATKAEFTSEENYLCFGSSACEKMLVTGNAEGIVLVASSEDGELYTSEIFNASDQKTFKKFGRHWLDEVSRINKIQIKQNGKVLFSGKIKIESCD